MRQLGKKEKQTKLIFFFLHFSTPEKWKQTDC